MNILISGGSRGLGLALCRALLDAGHSVASFARSETDDVQDLRKNFNERYRFDALDASDTPAVTALVSELDKEWGGIDALVNNAAIGQDSMLTQTKPEQIEDLMRVNLTAPILLTRAVTRSMLKRGSTGRVVMIGSIGAVQGYPGLTAYAATKGALESFARALAVEMRGRVLVNVVAPGFFESEMSSVLLPEQLGAIVRRTPSGELSTPEQVVRTVQFLLEANTNINGQVIRIDGGAAS